MKNKARLLLVVTTGLVVIGLATLFLFSKFKQHSELGKQAICYSVNIGVSVDSVFQFLGHSSNAAKWSSFVDHITPLNPHVVDDGQVGSERRCFKEANETGIVWDERITEVVKNKKRQLVIYHLQGFSVQAEGLATEQIYTPTKEGVRLTFCLFYKNDHPGWLDVLKTHYASFTVYSIFEKNLQNIKNILEGKPEMVNQS